MSGLNLPTYHRQRFLLALLELAGGKLTRTDLQKLLFLVVQDTFQAHYDFVPYRYGCYSFQAQSDIDLLENRGWLESKHEQVSLKESVIKNVLPLVWQQIKSALAKYSTYRGNALVSYSYEQYPYYAINSEIAEAILSKQSYARILDAKKALSSELAALFTIGYEGLSLEAYINLLIQHNVQLLCDVRLNPFSRKFGFSKLMLNHVLSKVGIKYVHIPELGIASNKRTNLELKADYERLFKIYRQTMTQRMAGIERIKELSAQYRRIAMTCFERDPNFCHRHCVSDYLIKENHKMKVVHI